MMNSKARKIALRIAAVVCGMLGMVAFVAGCGGGDGNGDGEQAADTPAAVTGRVVFVGASITDGWDFPGYFPGHDFQKVIHYSADKTETWDSVAALGPRLVVVKECAAYFNTDGGTPLAEYQDIIGRMVGLIRAAGAIPVLATTIPVDVGAGDCTQAQLNDINTFNAWLRGYCTAQGIVCMDLCAAVADGAGQLPSSFHDGDGLHPNETGYNALSPVALAALRSAGYSN